MKWAGVSYFYPYGAVELTVPSLVPRSWWQRSTRHTCRNTVSAQSSPLTYVVRDVGNFCSHELSGCETDRQQIRCNCTPYLSIRTFLFSLSLTRYVSLLRVAWCVQQSSAPLQQVRVLVSFVSRLISKYLSLSYLLN